MLKKFFKICLHIILVFVILTTLVFLLRELLFVSIKFLIGLRESFTQATRFGKLYLIMLYSFMFYICFELSYFANIIRSRKNTLIEKYFSDKENEGVNKYKMILMMLCIYISICLVGFSFYGFSGGKWNEANAANIINIFIWATYLIAPVVVIWVYIDWKSPKQYEIEKQYAEKLLDNINAVYFFMFERVNNLKALSNISNHVILLNGVVKNTNRYSDTPFYLAHGYLNLLNLMSNKKIDKSFLTNFERMSQLLDGHSNYIEEQYSLYYTPFSDELKSNHSIMCTPYDRIDLNAEQRVAIFQLNRYLTETLDSEVIKENGEKITVNLTFKEYIAKFKEEYEVLVNEIVVKYIKIQED